MSVRVPAPVALLSMTGCGGELGGAEGGSRDGGARETITCGIECSGQCIAGRCLVTLASAMWSGRLAVDATDVYWGGCWTLLKVPVRGGSVTTLYSGDSTGVAGIALDATSVYWTNFSDEPGWPGSVMKIPLGGGPTTTLAAGQYDTGDIVVDSASVYWTGVDDYSCTFRLMSAPLSLDFAPGVEVGLA
jgi:hypothetical protein